MKRVTKFLFSLVVFLLPVLVFAQETTESLGVSTKEILNAAIKLFKNWGSFSPYQIASSIIVIIVLVLGSNLLGGWFKKKLGPIAKRCIIGILSAISACLISIDQGVTWYNALWGTFVIGVGAVFIFELIISILPDTCGKAKSILKWIVGFLKKVGSSRSKKTL